jgi:O-acetyl-ADP-ribose deacetylase (regulator of RNase III)/NAD-dependent SIR2 family protein deacetylase
MTCIQKGYPNEAKRNEFFHKILLESHPSSCHYSVALLISKGYLKPTCFTTNFDHLIEHSFTQQRITEFQAIRADDECSYWQNREGRYYIIKLHGDIDTKNIMNTRTETLDLTESMTDLVKLLSKNSGLIVLGTSGNEKSIRKIFEKLGILSKEDRSVLEFGLLWGVYMGDKKPPDLTENELKKKIQERIRETEINQDIIDVIQDSTNELFCFFPVWGAGKFMLDLIRVTKEKELISKAAHHLDHEMRLRFIFANAGLTEEAIDQHLQKLRQQREKLKKVDPGWRPQPDLILKAESVKSNIGVRVMYGDITSRSLMSGDEFQGQRRAVVSPEDTCISAGGGVAYTLLLESGPKMLLNGVSKCSPILQSTVAVTSAGDLPVHYIIHAASLKIEKDASYSVNQRDVKQTMDSVLEKANSLEIGVLWTPLLAAGAASLNPIDSYEAILNSIAEYDNSLNSSQTNHLTITIVIYQEKDIGRNSVFKSFDTILVSKFKQLL